jgi:hypothetical protein
MKKITKKIQLGLLAVAGGIFSVALLTDFKFSLSGALKSIGVLLISCLFPLIIMLCVLGAFWLFRKYFPVQMEGRIEVAVSETNKYTKYSRVSIGLMFLGWPIGGIIAYILLAWFSQKWYGLFRGIFIAPIDKAFWIGPSIFIGLLFGVLFSILISRVVFKTEYPIFENYFNQASGFDSKKAMKIILSGYLILIFALMYVGLFSYTRFTQNGIYVHKPYLLVEEYHSYYEVIKIEETIRKGQQSTDHIFDIEFSDGKSWRTTSFEENEIPENFPLIMNYVANKSGKPYSKQILLDE